MKKISKKRLLAAITLPLILVLALPNASFAAESTTEVTASTATAEPTVAEPTATTPTAEPTVAEPTVTTPTAGPVAEPTPTTEPTTTKMVTSAVVEAPVAVDDEFSSTERGIVTGNALANDTWDSTLTAEIVSATLIFTWDERDDSEPPVALTYDPAGAVTVDFGQYVGTADTGQVRMAWVEYALRDSSGQTASAAITFTENGTTPTPDPEPDPGTFEYPTANYDFFGDPANHTVSGNVILNDTFDPALTTQVASASIIGSFINGVESNNVPAAWTLTFDPEGTVSVYFGQELPESDIPAAQVRYRLEDSEGRWSEAVAWFNYGVQSILNGCTATTDISWGAVLEQIDPGDATSWSDLFVTGDEVTSESLTFELLANGSLRTTEVMDADRCANTVAIFSGTLFFSNLIANMPPVVTPPVVDEPVPPVVTPPVVDEPTPPVVTPPVVDEPAPTVVTPPVVEVPAPPVVVNDPPVVIPNAGGAPIIWILLGLGSIGAGIGLAFKKGGVVLAATALALAALTACGTAQNVPAATPGVIQEKTARCVAKIFLDSDLSAEWLNEYVAGNKAYVASKADTKALKEANTKIWKECAE